MLLVSKSVTWLPEFVRRPLGGTPLETAYHHLAKYDVDLSAVTQLPTLVSSPGAETFTNR